MADETRTAIGTGPEPAPQAGQEPRVERDLLVEDVSVDGLCGVY